jgi:hypothetical protein
MPTREAIFKDATPTVFSDAKRISEANSHRFLQVHSWFQEADSIYIVMEHCRAASLREVVEKQKSSHTRD